MAGKFEKYGNEHKDAKKKRDEQVGRQCEITGQEQTNEKKIHAHHLQKISLAFLLKSHLKENMINLIEDVHMDFHKRTDSQIDDGKLIYKRQEYAKRVYIDPANVEERKKLDEADAQLIPEYIEKMLDLPYKYRETYIKHTLVGAYETNKALMINERAQDLKVKELEAQVEALQKELEDIKNTTRNKIIHLVDFQRAKRE